MMRPASLTLASLIIAGALTAGCQERKLQVVVVDDLPEGDVPMGAPFPFGGDGGVVPGGDGGSARGDGPCAPLACDTAAGSYCGRIGDGCGGMLDCGGCPTGQVC